jgi:alpha-amylase
MKKIYLGLFMVIAPFLGAMAQQVQLTLRVDMSQQTVSADGVHVAGNFQALAGFGSDWNPASTVLTDADRDGIYEVQVTLPTGGLFQYKFINGTAWTGAEVVPEACGLNDGAGNINRIIDATSATTIAPAYRFGTCETRFLLPITLPSGGMMQSSMKYLSVVFMTVTEMAKVISED